MRDFEALQANIRSDSIRANDPKEFQARLSALLKIREELRRRIRAKEAAQHSSEGTIEKHLNDQGFEYPEGIEQLDERIKLLSTVLKHIKNLNNFFSLESDTDIAALHQRFGQTQSLFNKYREIFQNYTEHQIELKSANSRLRAATKENSNANRMQRHIKPALAALNKIQTTHAKSKYLEAFLNDNREQIVETFRYIHSPNEFDNISFERIEKNKIEIFLDRKGSPKKAKLTEISTGQRAALALSIFLTLNRQLPQGPNILIFDDPVANVDDLNALSFLDYLREIAINDSRQIFFATANSDLAFLFKKKFDFLGSEIFKTIHLSR